MGMWEGKGYFPTGNKAYIKVIPKKGRDIELPSSYRPISLIDLDAKIMTKVLAERLAHIMLLIILQGSRREDQRSSTFERPLQH